MSSNCGAAAHHHLAAGNLEADRIGAAIVAQSSASVSALTIRINVLEWFRITGVGATGVRSDVHSREDRRRPKLQGRPGRKHAPSGPRLRHVAYLGSFKVVNLAQDNARAWFWQGARKRLDQLGICGRITSRDRRRAVAGLRKAGSSECKRLKCPASLQRDRGCCIATK